MLPGHYEDSGKFNIQWDPRDDFEDETDLGFVGEDKSGVWLRTHPQVLLDTDPVLWGVVFEWQNGLHEITAEDVHEKSNFEMEAKRVMLAAYLREEARMLPNTDEIEEYYSG